MHPNLVDVNLSARAYGICEGAEFSGEILGRSHQFSYSNHLVTVRLPIIEFEAGTNEPIGASRNIAHFQRGWVDDPSPERSFYALEYLIVEMDVSHSTRIPSVLIEHPANQKLPEPTAKNSRLEKISAQYDDLLASAWQHWLRVARWATNQVRIGLPSWESDESSVIKRPVLHEKTTGHAVCATTGTIRLRRPFSFDSDNWERVGRVLSRGSTPPIWFDYLVDAQSRLASKDFTGCFLSSAIACETLARAVYIQLIGTPKNSAAADLANKVAVQAIIHDWEKLTGIKKEGKLHNLFSTRNDLVHSGNYSIITSNIASGAIKTAQKFIEEGDKWWFDQKGDVNYRVMP